MFQLSGQTAQLQSGRIRGSFGVYHARIMEPKHSDEKWSIVISRYVSSACGADILTVYCQLRCWRSNTRVSIPCLFAFGTGVDAHTKGRKSAHAPFYPRGGGKGARGCRGAGRARIDQTSLNADLTSLKKNPNKRKKARKERMQGCGVGLGWKALARRHWQMKPLSALA